MRLPFTVEQFLSVFEKYNLTIWPMHVIFYSLGILANILAIKKTAFSNRTIGAVLSFFLAVDGDCLSLDIFR